MENMVGYKRQSISDLKNKLSQLQFDVNYHSQDDRNDPTGLVNSNSIQYLPDNFLMEIQEEKQVK